MSRILLLSAYDAASHRRWREQLEAMLPGYEWHALTLPPRFFQWRIRGNPVSWLTEPRLQESWDLIIATSMVDLATLRGLHPGLAHTPCLLYMHENQFAFPVSDRQRGRVEPQMVNLYSALAADVVAFNSAWNRDSFLQGVEAFLKQMPDAVPRNLPALLRAKARVLPVPIEDRLFIGKTRPINRDCPHLLWNHRWEYDKGPDRLFGLLEQLEQRPLPYRISVVGEGFRGRPEAFDRIQQRFAGRIEHWGFMEHRADYDRLLRCADVVVSTALHDFQGLAMLEAMASGCLPLAPDRLAYREYVPDSCRYASSQADARAEAEAAAGRLAGLLEQPPVIGQPHGWRASELRYRYRTLIESLLGPAQ
ncbi:tRNA-queuosine alpha-mannosyltransferase domain-containing protein [Marinobacter sp. VGCF2001]|uniref:tRNA-queuosine alpha-mannosyltransferase domain-containing protein n=1 Tax=Marinobacter sp. VGCF2001 TaxID=3417189 RepID=UPI003CEB4A6A